MNDNNHTRYISSDLIQKAVDSTEGITDDQRNQIFSKIEQDCPELHFTRHVTDFAFKDVFGGSETSRDICVLSICTKDYTKNEKIYFFTGLEHNYLSPYVTKELMSFNEVLDYINFHKMKKIGYVTVEMHRVP